MRIGVIPQGILERVALALGLVPVPLVDGFLGLIAARSVMAGARLGVFTAAAAGPLTSAELAQKCRTHPSATAKLADALVAAGLLGYAAGRYSLSAISRKWLDPTAPDSVLDGVLSAYVAADALDHLEEFVRTGKSVDFHRSEHPPETWEIYQRGMRSASAASSGEVARRTPVPRGARDLIDIGGGHGLHSVSLCRRHPQLRAVVLDLPEAIEPLARLRDQGGVADRVAFRPGNVLSDDLGEEAYDVAFMCQVAHHFDRGTNQDIVGRVARALRPGGVFVVQEFIRPESPADADHAAGLMNLFFGLTSEAGSWSLEEITRWQRQAGLRPAKPMWLRTAPGVAQQAAVKRR